MASESSIRVYDRDDDEHAHTPTSDPHWQESVVLFYYDWNSGFGGFHRIGYEPGGVGGMAKQVSWAGAADHDGTRMLRTLNHDITSEKISKTRFQCTEKFVADFASGVRWRVNDGDYKLDLTATDFSPRVSPFPHAGETVSDEYAAHHWESASKVSGSVALNGKTYQIDALGYRDHSWGRRNWSSLASHRWVAGTVGPAFTFCAASWQATDGTLASFGYIARDGVAEHAARVDILAYMEVDATTNRGGSVRMVLDNGENIVIEAKPAIPGFLSENQGIYCVDQICTFDYGGAIGICDFETTTNPRCGMGPVVSVINGSNQQGLTTDKFFNALKR